VARLIGVDVGGTKVSVAVLEDGVLSDPELTPTALESGDALIEQIVAEVRRAGGADAVGVGVPSTVDWATGTVRSSVNVPLHGVPLRMLLTDLLGMPVYVDNDGNVAALAEAYDDEMRLLADPLVMLTIGTGVGGGAVLGGRTFRGATGAAPELGHMIVAADLRDGVPPATGHFPHPDSLERWAAGRALDRIGEERGIGDGHAVVAAALDGDEQAIACLRLLGERVGVGVANVVNIFDPELVVLGGGVSRGGELVLGPAREAAHRFILPGVGTRTRIELARYGPRAGVRGAALLAAHELETT
jgi:glucokinase